MTFKVVPLETHIPAFALNGRLLAEWPSLISAIGFWLGGKLCCTLTQHFVLRLQEKPSKCQAQLESPPTAAAQTSTSLGCLEKGKQERQRKMDRSMWASCTFNCCSCPDWVSCYLKVSHITHCICRYKQTLLA